MRRTTLSLFLLAAMAGTAAAGDLYVGSSSSLFWQGDPDQGDFQALGACGGSIHSIGEDFGDLFLGDLDGRIYRYSDGIATYQFDALNDATALIVRGGALWIGGSDGKVYEVDKRDGTLLRTMDAQFAVSALLFDDGYLYAGSPLGIVHRADPDDGLFSFWGTCGGPVNSLAADQTHLIVGDTNGVVYRLALATQSVDGSFALASDATSMAMHAGDLFVGGSNGEIQRVDPLTGALIDTHDLGFDVQAMVLGAPSQPGNPYCYGISCPCGNDDILGGCANHLGGGAMQNGSGSASVSADDLVLTVTGLPNGGWSVPYMGSTLNELPFGDGVLCTGGGGYPVFRFQARFSGPTGTTTLGPGIVAHSQAHFTPQGGAITPGTTWVWQSWYRNPAGPCGNGFNTTNGYIVTFGP